MNVERKYSLSLDLVAGLVAGFLALLIVLVIWLGNQIGVRVTAQLPPGGIVGPFGPITLLFSQPVDEESVIDIFFTDPEVEGSFTLVGDKTIRFVPAEPLKSDASYVVGLGEGSLNTQGGFLKQSKSWKIQVRSPQIVYLVSGADQSRLWTIEPATGKADPLTDASFKIFDLDASHNGEFVIFSAFNEQHGIDLWQVARAGGAPTLLLQCGPDRCSVPAISFDDRRVAYVREAAAPTPDLPFGSPRIWVLDLETNEDSPVYEDQQTIGYGPVWSPDGTYLSSYDGIADEIRLLNLVTGDQFTLSSQIGNPVTWSGDGNLFVFTDVVTSDLGAHTRIREADLVTQEITTLVGEKDERDYRYNALAWSPAEDKLLIGLQPDEKSPAQAFWLMDPASLDGEVIADQPDHIYNNPSWDPWGKMLVFQQFRLKGVYRPEIGIWQPGAEAPQVIAEGMMPHWWP